MKIYFDIMKKRWYNESIFYWMQICLDWMKIHFGNMKKRWYNTVACICHEKFCSFIRFVQEKFPNLTFISKFDKQQIISDSSQ